MSQNVVQKIAKKSEKESTKNIGSVFVTKKMLWIMYTGSNDRAYDFGKKVNQYNIFQNSIRTRLSSRRMFMLKVPKNASIFRAMGSFKSSI